MDAPALCSVELRHDRIGALVLEKGPQNGEWRLGPARRQIARQKQQRLHEREPCFDVVALGHAPVDAAEELGETGTRDLCLPLPLEVGLHSRAEVRICRKIADAPVHHMRRKRPFLNVKDELDERLCGTNEIRRDVLHGLPERTLPLLARDLSVLKERHDQCLVGFPNFRMVVVEPVRADGPELLHLEVEAALERLREEVRHERGHRGAVEVGAGIVPCGRKGLKEVLKQTVRKGSRHGFLEDGEEERRKPGATAPAKARPRITGGVFSNAGPVLAFPETAGMPSSSAPVLFFPCGMGNGTRPA